MKADNMFEISSYMIISRCMNNAKVAIRAREFVNDVLQYMSIEA